jgi:nucleotide-binding universal stress UspA family protein
VTFASIMVYVGFDEPSVERVGVAAELATRFNAALIGVAGWPLRETGAQARSDVDFPPVEQSLQAKIAEELERLGEVFRRRAGAIPRGVEWRSSAHFPNAVIATEARAADLVIIGRDPLHGDVYHTFDPGAAILACGRPVLVVPRGIDHLQTSRVLIAWKETREARRAVYDALPFLQDAASVAIATIGPQDLEIQLREQIDDLANYLERHEVIIGAKIATSAREADGHVLLRVANEQRTDLIVAGAYGRSRLSERIFGGVTRDLLTGSKVPCLFAN